MVIMGMYSTLILLIVDTTIRPRSHMKSLHRFCGGGKRNYRSRFGGPHDAAVTHTCTCRLLCSSTLRFGGENANAARPMKFSMFLSELKRPSLVQVELSWIADRLGC